MTSGAEKGVGKPALSLAEIAAHVGAELIGDPQLVIRGVNSLEAAQSGEISFFGDRRYRRSFEKTRASAVLVAGAEQAGPAAQLVVANPLLAYARVAALFAASLPGFEGISPQAWVHESAQVGKGVSIFPFVYVGEHAGIGDGSVLFPGVYVGARAKVGCRSVLHPNVAVLHDCVVGDEVILHAGTVIGSDGFGFVRDGFEAVKIPQTGIVQVDDQVEIGANSCVDRAAIGKTWVQRGVKTDNLVQIAHNVVVGENTLIVSQAGISGSVSIGRNVILGGQVGIADHLTIGEGAMVGSQSGVAKDVPPGAVVSGSPAFAHSGWLKVSTLLRRLPETHRRIRMLEKKLALLEARLAEAKKGGQGD